MLAFAGLGSPHCVESGRIASSAWICWRLKGPGGGSRAISVIHGGKPYPRVSHKASTTSRAAWLSIVALFKHNKRVALGGRVPPRHIFLGKRLKSCEGCRRGREIYWRLDDTSD